MSELSGIDRQPTAPGDAQSAGAVLRCAREAAGLHIGALAVSLKVPVRKLEALEADDLTQLPDAVFARALASSVCRTLKIDPATVLALLPQIETPALRVGAQGGSPTFNADGLSAMTHWRAKLSRPVAIITALLLAGALALLLTPALERTTEGRVASPAGVVQSPTPTAPLLVPAAPIIAAAASVPAASVPVASVPVAAASEPAAGVAPDGATAALPTPDTQSVASAPSDDLIRITTRGSSWVQVRDGEGVLQLSKTLNEGDTAIVSGALPLSVIVGRADVTDVAVRGEPFDLGPVSKGNTARFQVK